MVIRCDNMKSIYYYLNKIKTGTIDGGNERTKAYSFNNDGVILVNKSEDDFDELKKRIKKCKDLAINIPEYYDYIGSEASGYWVLEELAKGEQFANLVNNDNGQDIINHIPYEQIEKYIRDLYLLGNNGIGVEPRRRNIFYDIEKGFTTIDVGLSNEIWEDSLESVNYFFQMFSRVMLVNFTEDEFGKNIREKTYLKVIKAFENGHPFFKKYEKWIFRGDIAFATFLEKNGYNFVLNEDEHNELINYIDALIKDATQNVINNAELIYSLGISRNYVDLLKSSIEYCPQFDLSKFNGRTLFDFIKMSVWEKIKLMFLENLNNENLKKLYYEIRRRELDPVRKYSEEYIIRFIDDEIKALNNKKTFR